MAGGTGRMHACVLLLAIITCVTFICADQPGCKSEMLENATVDIKPAVNQGASSDDPVYVPGPYSCVEKCCFSRKISGDKNCTLAIYDSRKTGIHPNCYLFHCPTKEACPTKPSPGITSFLITQDKEPTGMPSSQKEDSKPASIDMNNKNVIPEDAKPSDSENVAENLDPASSVNKSITSKILNLAENIERHLDEMDESLVEGILREQGEDQTDEAKEPSQSTTLQKLQIFYQLPTKAAEPTPTPIIEPATKSKISTTTEATTLMTTMTQPTTTTLATTTTLPTTTTLLTTTTLPTNVMLTTTPPTKSSVTTTLHTTTSMVTTTLPTTTTSTATSMVTTTLPTTTNSTATSMLTTTLPTTTTSTKTSTVPTTISMVTTALSTSTSLATTTSSTTHPTTASTSKMALITTSATSTTKSINLNSRTLNPNIVKTASPQIGTSTSNVIPKGPLPKPQNATPGNAIKIHVSSLVTPLAGSDSKVSLKNVNQKSGLQGSEEDKIMENVMNPDSKAGDRSGLIAALVFGVVFFVVVLVLVTRRGLESIRKRHYSRLDYLINGMYIDT